MLVASDTQQPHGVRIRERENEKYTEKNRLGVLFLAFVRPASTRQDAGQAPDLVPVVRRGSGVLAGASYGMN